MTVSSPEPIGSDDMVLHYPCFPRSCACNSSSSARRLCLPSLSDPVRPALSNRFNEPYNECAVILYGKSTNAARQIHIIQCVRFEATMKTQTCYNTTGKLRFRVAKGHSLTANTCSGDTSYGDRVNSTDRKDETLSSHTGGY